MLQKKICQVPFRFALFGVPGIYRMYQLSGADTGIHTWYSCGASGGK